MNTNERTYYRIVTPYLFSDLEAYTLDEAKDLLKLFGQSGSRQEYWQKQMALCTILKVTEITELIVG